MVLVTNDVRQHNFHKQKFYLLRIFSIDPASISVKKGLFSSEQHRSTRINNSLHSDYLTSLVTRTNHQWRRPGAEFGGTEIFSRGPRFLNDVFSEKFSIFTAKISDDDLF